VVFPYWSCAGGRRLGDRPWRHLEVSLCDSHQRGRAFLLVFLLFSFTLGVAVLVGETLLGSRSQRGVLGAFHKLVGPNWRWMGYMGILCGFFIYSFYSVVGAGPWAMRPWPWAASST
jgi:SNF family Na+-dependent transporter